MGSESSLLSNEHLQYMGSECSLLSNEHLINNNMNTDSTWAVNVPC